MFLVDDGTFLPRACWRLDYCLLWDIYAFDAVVWMLACFIIYSLIVFNYYLKSATFPLSTELWRESVELDLLPLAEFVLAVPDLDMKW